MLLLFLEFYPFPSPQPQERQNYRQQNSHENHDDVGASELADAKEGGYRIRKRRDRGYNCQVEYDDSKALDGEVNFVGNRGQMHVYGVRHDFAVSLHNINLPG